MLSSGRRTKIFERGGGGGLRRGLGSVKGAGFECIIVSSECRGREIEEVLFEARWTGCEGT